MLYKKVKKKSYHNELLKMRIVYYVTLITNFLCLLFLVSCIKMVTFACLLNEHIFAQTQFQ